MTRSLFLTALLLVAATAAHAQRLPVTTASDAARAHYDRGFARLVQNDFPTAALHFDAALAADPDFTLARVYRASSLADGRAEHLRLATAAAARATDAERQLVESYAAGQSGDAARQAALLTALATRFPDSPELPLWLSLTELNRDDAPAAAAAARRTLTADPAFGPAYNLLGYAEAAQENWPAAEAAFREYARLAPDEANPYDSMGEILYNQGRFDEAEAQFRMALARNPGFASSSNFIARIGIERTDRRFEEAAVAGDGAALAALYAANAVVMPPDHPPVVGAEAIRAFMDGFAAMGARSLDIETVEVRAFDDVAIQRADLTIGLPDGTEARGKSLVMWRRVGDDWLYLRDMWSLNGAEPSAAGTR